MIKENKLVKKSHDYNQIFKMNQILALNNP